MSTAGHVGPALLGAWQHKLVTDAVLRRAVDSILSTPRMPVGAAGTCIAYSKSGNDNHCVPNVSLGAGAWLLQVREVTGWSIPLLDDIVSRVTAADRYLYDAETGYWAYSDLASQRDKPQDPGHQGYTLSSVLVLDPDFGRAATLRFLSNPWWAQPVSAWVYPPEWRFVKNGEIRVLPTPYAETREKCLEVLAKAGAGTYEPPK